MLVKYCFININFLSNVALTNRDLEGVADKRERHAEKVPFLWEKVPFSAGRETLRYALAFIWWSYRIIKHANMFEAFIRVATRRTPNAFHQRFPTGHMTIRGQTTKQRAIQPKI